MKNVLKRDLPITAFDVAIVVPKGTPVEMVRKADGVKGDMWAIADVALLKRLTGNDHDPEYRYVFISADDVEGDVFTPDVAAKIIADQTPPAPASLKELEEKLRALLKGNFAHLYLTFNAEHALNYSSADVWVRERHYDSEDWSTPEDLQRSIETNSVWTLQFYPDTPIGFYTLRASSLDVLMKMVEDFQ